ncbi:MAG TPA: hypothetical protein VIL85_20415 [Thermomicrobiales bacterium]|jgi:hypothetical protein
MIDRFTERFTRPVATLALAVTLGLVACGGGSATPTPLPPTATATVARTATTAPTAVPTAVPTRPAAPATATRSGGSPIAGTPGTPGASGTPGSAAPNPAAVTSAYANLQKQQSYHLEIKVDGLGTIVPLGIGNTLTYTIDANGTDQKIVIDDGTGVKQEGYKVGGRFYSVTNGQVSEVTSLPLIFTLPELLYTTLTAPGTMTFTSSGDEQINGRSATKYTGTGSVARLAANPLFALAIPNAQGTVSGPIWVESSGSFLVAADLTITLTAPQAGTAKLRLDVTRVGQVGPITAPR